VADAHGAAESAGESPVERKARALLGKLAGKDRDELARRLDAYLAASGSARETAEEALLDFFLDVEVDDGGGE
jgi:molecular chaperone DnaK